MAIYYTKDHEWIEIEGNNATIGITRYAQEQLGDLVYVELPEIDQEVVQEDSVVVVESVKAASDVYSPLSGKVTEINEKITEEPSLVNHSPEEKGWLWKMELNENQDLSHLLDRESYEAML